MLLCERVNSDKRMCIFIRKEEEEPSVVSATEGKERKPKATLELLTQQGGFHGLLTSATREVLFLLRLTCSALSSWRQGQGQPFMNLGWIVEEEKTTHVLSRKHRLPLKKCSKRPVIIFLRDCLNNWSNHLDHHELQFFL